MGLTEKEMLELLSGADLSEESKKAICELISANNKRVEKEIPGVYAKSVLKAGRKLGK